MKRTQTDDSNRNYLIAKCPKCGQLIVIKGSDLNKLQIQGVATMVMKNL